MSASLLVGTTFRAFDPDTGAPLSFGKVYTYESGSSILKKTWTSATKEVENTNPIVLNGAGWADIYLDGSYKIQVYDKNGVLINTADPIRANDLSQWINRREAQYETNTRISVSGEVAGDYPKYRRLKIHDDNRGIIFATVEQATESGNRTLIEMTEMTQAVSSGVTTVWSSIVTRNAMPGGIPQQIQALLDETRDKMQSFLQTVENQVHEAMTWANKALSHYVAASDAADEAENWAETAQNYAQQAHGYADAAAAAVASSGKIYERVSDGIADTQLWEYFWVQVENPASIALYEHKHNNTADKIFELISSADLANLDARIDELGTSVSNVRGQIGRNTEAIEELAWPIKYNDQEVKQVRNEVAEVRTQTGRNVEGIEALAWPIHRNLQEREALAGDFATVLESLIVPVARNANGVQALKATSVDTLTMLGHIVTLETKLSVAESNIVNLATVAGAVHDNGSGKAIQNFSIGA